MYIRVSQKTQMLGFNEPYRLFWLEWGSDPPTKNWWVFLKEIDRSPDIWSFGQPLKLIFTKKMTFQKKS